jgi:glycosyltransferase involved in cell wall biosynthesis
MTSTSIPDLRIAIVHYWLLGMRGGERVLEAMCELFPQAEIFTLFYDPDRVSPFLRSRKIHVSGLNPMRRFYQHLLPVMPLALESFDLRGYDLVISSESGPAKGVLVPSGARHICYCHTPMRYLWDLYPFYRNEVTRSPLQRALMAPIANYLRVWDYASAVRVDQFVANSENVRRRIRRAYGREAGVVHPPVPVNNFRWRNSEDYYLVVSEMTPYKRLDYAVRAFSRSGRRLKVAGDGPQYRTLRALAAGNIEFCGRVSDEELRDLYSRSRALVMPGEEDFGMTMVESLASGKPVIALGRGGAAEIVKEDCGILYQHPGEEFLERAIQQFESAYRRFDPIRLRRESERYSPEIFARGLRAAVEGAPARLDRRGGYFGVDDSSEGGERGEGHHQRPVFRGR